MALEVKVKDIMTPRVVTCKSTTLISEAAKRMRDEDIGSIIVTEGQKPVGIVTREDMTNKVAAMDLQPSKTTVKAVMNSPIVTCPPDSAIEEAAKLMNKHGYERLPVKSLNKLVGIVSVRDILRVAPGLLDFFKERLELEEPAALGEETTSGDCELCGNYTEELHNVNNRWVCEACSEEASEL